MKKTVLLRSGLVLFFVALLYFGGACKSSPTRLSGEGSEGDITVSPQPGMVVIVSADFSPDKKRIISGQMDRSIRIWDAESGRQIRSFNGHPTWVLSVAWSPDGKKFLSCDHETLKVWEAETCRELWSAPNYAWSAVWSPDGKTIAAGTENGTIKLLDAANYRETGEISGLCIDEDHTSNYVVALCFSPNGELIAASSVMGMVELFNAKTGETIKTLAEQIHFEGEGGEVNGVHAALAFSPDGKRLAASQFGEQIIRVYDVESEIELYRLAGNNQTVNSVAFSPDDKYIVSCSTDYSKSTKHTVRIWDSKNGKELYTYQSGNTLQFVSFLGNHILAGTAESLVEIDVETGEELRSFRGNNSSSIVAALSPQGDVFFADRIWNSGALDPVVNFSISSAYSPDGSILAILDLVMQKNHEGEKKLTGLAHIILVEAESGKELGRLSEFHLGNNFNMNFPFGFNSDGKRIISGSSDGHVYIWDVESKKIIQDRPLHKSVVTAAAFGPGGLIASCSTDGTIKVWDEQTIIPRTFSRLGESVKTLAFSPDGKHIIMSSENRIILLDLRNGKEIWSTKEHGSAIALAYNPEGNNIFAGSISGPRILDAATGQAVFSLPETGGFMVIYAAYSQDGKYLFYSTIDSAHLCDAKANKEIAQFVGFKDGEWIVITPDGYYNSTPKGDQYLNVRIGNNVYGIDQFRKQFYRPDIVEVARSGNSAAYQAMVRRAGTSITKTSPPPQINILTLNDGQMIKDPQPELTVEIYDENHEIKNVWITINGRMVAGQSAMRDVAMPEDGLYVTGKDRQMLFTIPLDVEDGSNIVEVFAYNGYAEARAAVSFVADIDQTPPNLWLLAIGVNDYSSSLVKNLSYAVNDAQRLAEAFKRQEGKNYGKVNTLVIADGEERKPTARVIRENFSWFKQAENRDLCVLFIAGHAVNDSGGKYYFLPSDTVFDKSGNLNPRTAISHKEINAVLDMPGRKLFILDTCHSAGAGRAGMADANSFIRQAMEYYPVIFSSSKGNELSQESPEYQHGLFTYSIIQGMGGEAVSRGGTITMKSLDNYVSEIVSDLSGGRQNPTTNTPNGYVNFILAVP
jgi:WD40 repeat protein